MYVISPLIYSLKDMPSGNIFYSYELFKNDLKKRGGGVSENVAMPDRFMMVGRGIRVIVASYNLNNQIKGH